MAQEYNEIGQISFFLSRSNVTFEGIIDPDEKLDQIESLKIINFVEDDVPCRFIYFETRSTRDNPPWLTFINEKFKAEEKVQFQAKSKSPNGILLMKFDDRILAATFGRKATSCLNLKTLEDDFGIKTAMNLCGNEEVRQTKSQSNAITTTFIDRQVARPSDTFSFGLSEAEDLRYISTHMKGDKNITLQGKNSLTIKVIGREKLDWPRLISQCRIFLREYESKAYVNLFPNYKNFRAATDTEVEMLDAIMRVALSSKELDKFQLCIPEFLQDDDYSFSFTDHPKKENIIHSLLDVEQLLELFNVEAVTIEELHRKKVYAFSHAEDRVLSYRRWSIYDCLVFECKTKEGYFILSSGKWSEVDNNFYKDITNFIENVLKELPCENAYKDIDIFDKDSSKKNEESIFNNKVCELRKTAIKFDRAKLKVGQGRKDKEFCDILDLEDDGIIRIVHCKPYKGASSINYLFSQAKFYGEAFLTDQTFLNDIRNHISLSASEKKDEYLKYLKGIIEDVSGNDYRVCLWLLYDNKYKSPTKTDIPLISQYELKLTHDYLRKNCKFKDVIIRFVPVKMTRSRTGKMPKKAA